MNTYSVKEIADMLNINTETVRRWIREKRLEATMASKKEGHIISEDSLRRFLNSTPKYAATIRSSLVGLTVLPAVTDSKLFAQKLDIEKLRKDRSANKEVINILCREIQKYIDAIKAKKDTIHQIQKQIEEDQSQIIEFQKLIDSLYIDET